MSLLVPIAIRLPMSAPVRINQFNYFLTTLAVIGGIFGYGKSVALAQNQALGITVSPVQQEITLNPGQNVEEKLRVTNPTSSSVTLYFSVLNFTSDNQDGKPTFYSDSQRSSRFSLSSWITPNQKSLDLLAGQTKEVSYSISAPITAESGGHYGAILLSTQQPENTQGGQATIGVVGLVGSLLLVTVPGNTVSHLDIDDFQSPSFLLGPPAIFTTILKNTGTIHLAPEGVITLKNWTGNTVTNLNINDKKGNILPQSQRTFENSWPFDWKSFGRYTATLIVNYGSPQQQISTTRIFYIIPWWLLIGIGILLLLCLTIIILRRKNNRQSLSAPVSNVPPSAGKQW